MLPAVLDLRITSKCNQNCKFCFGTVCKHELTFSQWEMLLERFWNNGVKSLVITGGEPTYYEYLHELLLCANSYGFTTTLSTNGALFKDKHLDDILNNLDWISIPLEGSTYEKNFAMREMSFENYRNILKLIEYVKSNYKTKIKLGTVVSKKNKDDIKNLTSFAKKYADTWKLYQVYLHGKSESIINEFSISDAEYESLIAEIQSYYGKNINIVKYSKNTMNGKYLFCEPDGSAMTIANNTETILGSFLSDFDHVLNTWNDFIDEDKLLSNYNLTYAASGW